MKVKEIVKILKSDFFLRGYLLASVSFFANVLFFAYNLFLGVFYGLVWNFSVSFYYLLLMLVKAVILYSEKRWQKEGEVQEKRVKLFKAQSLFLFLIDVALIAPIALLLLEKKTVNIGQIPTIAIAAYATYKIIMACVQYRKVKKKNNLSLQALKTIHLKETIVSIITLQNTMVTVFGNAKQMLPLTFWTSVGLWGLIILTSIFSIINAKVYK